MAWLPIWRKADPVEPVDPFAGGSPPVPVYHGLRIDQIPAGTRAAQLLKDEYGVGPAEAMALFQRGCWPPK